MNGRVYSPWLGRFLSPDPYVQVPENRQSYNRYSYCLNNPLKYTDPAGYMRTPDSYDNIEPEHQISFPISPSPSTSPSTWIIGDGYSINITPPPSNSGP
ncbi:MAG: hypothetical protein PHD25_08750 [Bacteroidales bacterium]|nr:hypothetical protein [Bacteroidales bacterium]